MNIINIINSNLKINNIGCSNVKMFMGTPLINNKISLIKIDNKTKKIVDEEIIILNNDEFAFFNYNIYDTNNFIVYKYGYELNNFNDNNRIIYLSNLFENNRSVSHFSVNIYTTILAYKIIQLGDYDKDTIIKTNKSFINKIKKKLNINIRINLSSLIKTNYYNYFIENKLIDNIYNFYDKKKLDNYYIITLIEILKFEIKLNFLLLLILRFNPSITDDEIFKFYDYLWENLDSFNPTSESINNFYGYEIIKNEYFDKIISSWFMYIDFCHNLIYLFNICNNYDIFSDEELNSEKINKKDIINKYLKYDNFKNNLDIFCK